VSTPRRLLTIPISHYCEKARWALQRARLEYVEKRHIQGVHRVVVKRAGGRATVPVLLCDEGVITESEHIIRYADRQLEPDQRLFPEEPGLRDEVESLCRWLDRGLGQDGRRLMYAYMLPQRDLMLRFNNQGVPKWESLAMKRFYRRFSEWGNRELEIHSASVFEDEMAVRRSFDVIAERLADGRRYLCGDRFTAADLTFACLASSVILPPQYGVRLPQPEELPDNVARVVRAFREHPAGGHALWQFLFRRSAAAWETVPDE
jgi:glutathione S-transferase